MNKSLLLNVCWLAIAVAAFVVGRITVAPGDDSATSESGRNGGSAIRRGPDGTPLPGSRGDRSESRGGRGIGDNSDGVPTVTVGQFLRESDSLQANKLFADLLLGLDADNAPAIFDQLVENRVEDQRIGLFLEAWGKLDGAAAMEAVANLQGDGRRRAMASLSVISGWATVDPEAAKAHIAGAEEGWEKAMLNQGFVSGLAKSDPLAATDYVLELEAAQQANPEGQNGDDRWRGFAFDRQLDAIANEQLRRGTTEATSWAESLPEGSIKAAAFDRVAEKFASDDPEAAAEWIKSHAGNEYAERGVREVVEELARRDPAQAASWIEELPADSQPRAMAETFNRWTREDPVAAGEYLTSMPQSPVRDSAVSSFARELDREDPSTAAQWAATIGDAEMRTETLSSVARSWLRTNPDQAKQWLPTSGLTQEAQENAIRDAERGGDRGDWRGRGPGR